MDRVGLIVRRRRRAGEIIDLVYRQIDRINDVVSYIAERVKAQEVAQIFHSSRGKIVHTDDGPTFTQKKFTKMRS